MPEHPRSCCSARGSIELRNYMKSRAKELGIDDIRVNNAGCLERCELGPAMVIYPEGVWYHYDSTEDVDEILQKHIVENQPVKRLMLEDGQKFPEHRGFDRLRLRVSSIHKVSSDVLRIEFVNADSGKLPRFSAGSHLDLLVDNDRIRRSYALMNDPCERNRYVIGVLKSGNRLGGASWLHSELRHDDVIEARCPESIFQINESAASHILIAEGIGIAPILSMSYRLRQAQAEFRVHFFMSSTASAEFADELRSICGHRLLIHGEDNTAEGKRVLDRNLSDRPDGAHLYICGSRQLMADAASLASDWPAGTIHNLHFFADASEPTNPQAFNVSLARRQKTLRVSRRQSVLDALRASDIPIEYACEEGLCGACRVKVLFGQVEHFDSVLTEEEKSSQSTMMACTSRAATGETRLVLDI